MAVATRVSGCLRKVSIQARRATSGTDTVNLSGIQASIPRPLYVLNQAEQSVVEDLTTEAGSSLQLEA